MGSLACAKFLSMGRLQLITSLNIILAIGVGISLVGKYIWLMCIGRFIWGVAYGSFSVVCAKFINEITPTELLGPFGAINQLSLTFGLALPSTLALAYPSDIKTSTDPDDDFYVNSFFRVIWSLPLVVIVIQMLLIMTCFRNESPVYLKEKGEEEKLLTVMKKFYEPNELRKRLDQLAQEAA